MRHRIKVIESKTHVLSIDSDSMVDAMDIAREQYPDADWIKEVSSTMTENEVYNKIRRQLEEVDKETLVDLYNQCFPEILLINDVEWDDE